MKLFARSLIVFTVLSLAALTLPVPTGAFPPLPSSFYGKIKLDGAYVPDGTRLEAWIGDLVMAFCLTESYQGDSVYSLDVPGDDTSTQGIEGGVEGDVIYFKLDGFLVDQTATWHSGTNQNLDLSAISTVATNTPLPTPTEIPATLQPGQDQNVPTTTATSQSQPTQATGDVLASAPEDNTIYLPEAKNAGEAEPTATFRPGMVKIVDESYPPTATPEPGSQNGQASSPPDGSDSTAGTSESTVSVYWILVPVFFLIVWLFGLWYIKKQKKESKIS